MGELAVMDPTHGDLKIIWDPSNEEEVESVRRQFADLIAKGHMAYKVTGEGRKGVQVREFDPEVEKLILAPALRGG